MSLVFARTMGFLFIRISHWNHSNLGHAADAGEDVQGKQEVDGILTSA